MSFEVRVKGEGGMESPRTGGVVSKSRQMQGTSRSSKTSGIGAKERARRSKQNEGPMIKRVANGFIGARSPSSRARSHSVVIERNDKERKASLAKEKSSTESQLYVWGKRPPRDSEQTDSKNTILERQEKEMRSMSVTKEKSPAKSQLYVWGKRPTRASKQIKSKNISRRKKQTKKDDQPRQNNITGMKIKPLSTSTSNARTRPMSTSSSNAETTSLLTSTIETTSLSTSTANDATTSTNDITNGSDESLSASSRPLKSTRTNTSKEEDVASIAIGTNVSPSKSTATSGNRDHHAHSIQDGDMESMIRTFEYIAIANVFAMVDFACNVPQVVDAGHETPAGNNETKENRDDDSQQVHLDDGRERVVTFANDTSFGTLDRRDTYSLMFDMTDTYDDEESVGDLFSLPTADAFNKAGLSIMDRARTFLSPLGERRAAGDVDDEAIISKALSLDWASKKSQRIVPRSGNGGSSSECKTNRNSPVATNVEFILSGSSSIGSKILTKAGTVVGVENESQVNGIAASTVRPKLIE